MYFSQTYSRSHLQTLTGKQKHDALKLYVDSEFTDSILRAARAGKTSFFRPEDTSVYSTAFRVLLTKDDIVEALTSKFPDCTVTYQEMWVDTRIGVRELKKGYLVEWT
jgi:hypothetical protein